MRFILTLFLIVVLCNYSFSFEEDSLTVKQNNSTSAQSVTISKSATLSQLVATYKISDSVQLYYVKTNQLHQRQWDTLAHPYFWKTVMTLSPDSCVINIKSSRKIVESMSMKEWDEFTDDEKEALRNTIRKQFNLDDEATIYRTKGKSNFYTYKGVLPIISKGVKLFAEQGVDPWYAQAILMIECPGQIKRSVAGAHGHFQLMPYVARMFGLTVNRYKDERKDFDKSALAASKFIDSICIPEAKKILANQGIHSVDEHSLWFRLFVMHIYNAGSYNVNGVVQKINPKQGGKELIQKMWVTSYGRFRNASQNYSQLTLAALLILDNLIQQKSNEYLANRFHHNNNYTKESSTTKKKQLPSSVAK